MPHKCVHCDKIYKDASQEILTGCSCGSKFFFYIRKEKLEQIKKHETINLSPQEKSQVEEDVRDIAGITDEETPIFLDFESIKIIKPGTYILDIPKLFSQDRPRIYQLEDGKYVIDLITKLKKQV
jgi:predicted  nucleic acid-binding Zn-ribbon protein